MNCKKCSFWDDEENDTWIGRTCHNPNILPGSIEVHLANASLQYYDEGGKGVTGPDFGCIHFEQKS